MPLNSRLAFCGDMRFTQIRTKKIQSAYIKMSRMFLRNVAVLSYNILVRQLQIF